jgi:hypothetical protein
LARPSRYDFVRRNHISGDNQFQSLFAAYKPRKGQSGNGRKHAHLDFRLAEFGPVRSDHHIAIHGQFATPSQRCAIDGCQGYKPEVIHSPEHAVENLDHFT